MAKQRNEPNDPAAELADYDFSKSDGTSADGDGEITVEQWPSHLDKEELTESGIEVIETWVNSHYSNVTMDNIRKFADQFDYSPDTAKTWLYRAYPNARDYSDLTKSEKKAAVVYAAHGEANSYNHLISNFDVHNRALSTVVNGVPEIIEDLRNRHTKKKLRKEAAKFKIESPPEKGEKTEIEELSDKEREAYLDYFSKNPEASVEEARKDVGIDASNLQIGNIKGGAVAKLKKDKQKSVEEESSKTPDGLKIKLNVTKEEARKIVKSQSLPQGTRGDIVDKILDEVGL